MIVYFNPASAIAGSGVTPEQGSVIVPTYYTRTTAPRLFAALHQLHGEKPIDEARREAWLKEGEAFRLGANAVTLNRIGLQMNEKGEIEPAVKPEDRLLPKIGKVPGTKPDKGKQAGGKGSAMDSLGPLGNAIRTIAGKDKKALAASERMAERGHKGLLQDIVEHYATKPADGQAMLKDIGKLNDKKLDGLNAIREALKTGDLTRSAPRAKTELNWLDIYTTFPKKHRDEILSLVGDILQIVISGLPATLSMAIRRNPHDIPGSLVLQICPSSSSYFNDLFIIQRNERRCSKVFSFPSL